MPELQRLRADHAEALLAFETVNRAWFAGFVSDRGDDWFAQFDEHLEALLVDDAAGEVACYVLVGDDGTVLGRVNLNLGLGDDGVATLGYRVAEAVAGRGVATAAVREVCSFAAARHGVRRLRAATSYANVASQRVLLNAGFVAVGPADPAEVGGKQGTAYERDVAGPGEA